MHKTEFKNICFSLYFFTLQIDLEFLTADMEAIQKAIREEFQKKHEFVKTMEEFSKMKTNEERVKFVLSLPVVQKHIHL